MTRVTGTFKAAALPAKVCVTVLGDKTSWKRNTRSMRENIVRTVGGPHSPTVFVLNVSLAGLGAIRSLGRADVPVVGLDPDPNHAGFASHYCRAKQCPHPVFEPQRLLEFLIDEGKRLSQPGVISSASDGFMLFVSQYRDELGAYFRLCLPPRGVIESLVNKRRLYEVADQLGVPHATLYSPDSMDDVHRFKNDLEYPVYIKPCYSYIWETTFPSLGKGIKAFSADELVARFATIFAHGAQAIVQSLIAGPASNVRTVYVYMGEGGKPLAALTTRKYRQYPVEFGTGSLAESYFDPELKEKGIAFFRRIGYRGFGTVEFKRDNNDGEWKLTDVNPRRVKPINLPIAAGIDFPLIQYLDVIGQPPEPQMTYRAGVRWVEGLNDLASSWHHIRSGELTPWAWARSWLGVRTFSVFAIDDWGPFLKESRYGLRLLRLPLSLLRRRQRAGGSRSTTSPGPASHDTRV